MMPQPADLPIDIPPAWRRLPIDDVRGTLLVVGAPDTGKSTFARYIAVLSRWCITPLEAIAKTGSITAVAEHLHVPCCVAGAS